ncbi:MAG: hypothetical protein LIO92_08745 [Clostridiales bacterium]|nr:hypothetical protein [Clostridiales bacterium]
MTNKDFIMDSISDISIGVPIYISDLAAKLAEKDGIDEKKASAAVSVAMKRIMDQGLCPKLRIYQKGIYYLAEETPFGETGINKELLIQHKYLSPDIGYETGYAALYHFGLTTQMPGERVLVTNRAKDCQRLDETLGVYVRPPKVKVTAKNKDYLQVLDVLELMEKAPVDNSDPYGRVADILIQYNLKYSMLLALAEHYYPQNLIFQIAHTATAAEGVNG